MALNAYSIENRCPKCGVAPASVVHHPAGVCDVEPLEHMHRVCHQCGYPWAEAPLDASPDRTGD